ncbi:MAG TPA: EAL domain-containing protein [Usitatibacteraceae bacterium]|nr:EAL domain-containing protein [Usitatibacteraceae bacterium]
MTQTVFPVLFHSSPVPIAFSRMRDGRYLEANQACLDLFGYTREEAYGKTTLELGIFADARQREDLIARIRRENRIERLPLTLNDRLGRPIHVLYSAQVIEYAGEPCIVATLVDVTPMERAERNRRLSEERFAKIFDANPDAIVISRLSDGTYLEVNAAWEKLSGFSREELVGRRSTDLGIWLHPEQRAALAERIRTGERVRDFPFELRRRDGTVAESILSGEVIELNGEQCLLAILADVTERNKVDRQLKQSQQRFSDVLDAAGEHVWEVDNEGRYVFLSPRAESVLGYPLAELIGKTPAQFMPEGEADRVRMILKRGRVAGEPIRNLEHRTVRKDGREVWLQVSGVPVRDDSGAVVGMRGTGLDITGRKEAERVIEELATLDTLTQLPNRRLLNDRLAQGIHTVHRNGGLLAVLFIDLDRFKNINDSLGHPVGDELLRAVSRRLMELMRKGDTLSRIGGDEFVVVLGGLRNAEDAGHVAQKILSALGEPLTIGEHRLNTSASIGISVFPGDALDGTTLLRNADMAMYYAKEHGRRNYKFFSAEMNARAVERLSLESTLRRALEEDQFELHYQPKFNLADGSLTGAEALIRWRHPDLGLVPPAKFVPICEETGLIIPMGRWVLETACKQAASWLAETGREVPVAVNLSVGQFDRSLSKTVHDALAQARLGKGMLELEITESMLMQNALETTDALRQLGKLGVRIAIDDFGTGYSSLAYLRRFQVDTLKIDGSFVHELETSLDDNAIVEAIVAMARSLQLTVVAEGVERDTQRARLAEMGCDQYQGYLHGVPVDAATFARVHLAT